MTATSHNPNEPRILSHGQKSETIEQTVERIKQRIRQQGDTPDATVESLLLVVDELAGFPLGRFLLQNQGFDGYWIDYLVWHPYKGRITGTDPQGRHLTKFEKWLLDENPMAIATQQRAVHFSQVIQKQVKEGAIMASVPCGLMRELLALDFSGIENFCLVGIDLDIRSLHLAQSLAEEYGLSKYTEFHQGNAWDLPFQEPLTLLSSNGLNVYEPDDSKVTELYRHFFKALRPGGVLVTSFLTPPPALDPNSEWDLDRIDWNALLELKKFLHVLEAKFQYYRSPSTTYSQLQTAGFEGIEFIWDEARIYPTAVARKPE